MRCLADLVHAPDPAAVARTLVDTALPVLSLAEAQFLAPVDRQEIWAAGVTYKRSKIAAERLVEGMIARDRLPAVIVNPSTPIGPRDVKPTPTGRIIVEAACGRIPGFVDTGLNLVHVDDVADGHLAALRRGAVGERYILGGENVRFAEMLGDIARLVGRKPPALRVPRAVALSAAYVAEGMARFTGREPFATVDGIRAHGGSMNGSGPVVADGMVFTNSGYARLPVMPGNLLLAFSVQ